MAAGVDSPVGHSGSLRRQELPLGLRARFVEVARRNLWGLLTLPALLFMLVMFVYPLVAMLSISVFDPGPTLRHYRELFGTSAYLGVVVNTMRLAGIITLASLALGYPLAYVLARARGLTAAFLIAAIVLPLWTSDLVRTYAWTVILGLKGPVNLLLVWLGIFERPHKLLYTELAVLIGSVHIMLPFMVLPLFTVMKGIDGRLVQAAEIMGANPCRAFLQVFLPLSMPGIVAGTVLTFILAVGFYITPAMLGSGSETMIAMLIETQARRALNWGLASALAVLLLAVTTLLLILLDRIFGLDRSFGRGARA